MNFVHLEMCLSGHFFTSTYNNNRAYLFTENAYRIWTYRWSGRVEIELLKKSPFKIVSVCAIKINSTITENSFYIS